MESSHKNKENPNGVGLALTIFSISLISCFLPKVLSNSKIIRRYFPIVNLFSAGLQLATIVVDLIPHLNPKQHTHNFYPYVSIGLCFLTLISIDLIFLHNESSNKESSNKESSNKESGHKESGCNHNITSCGHNHNGSSHNHSGPSHSHNMSSCSHDNNLGTCNTAAISTSKSKSQALLFLLAISIHSFFEGLPVSCTSKNMSLLTSLISHKILESFSIGNSVEQSKFSGMSKTILVTFYSMLTPSAILIGNHPVVKSIDNVKTWFNALCMGSMMFIVFYEGIGHGFHNGKDTVKKLAGIYSGFIAGSAAIIAAHSDHHHHCCGHHHH